MLTQHRYMDWHDTGTGWHRSLRLFKELRMTPPRPIQSCSSVIRNVKTMIKGNTSLILAEYDIDCDSNAYFWP